MSDHSPGEVTPEGAWRLSPSVAVRDEPFGALVYHFGNRKLTFLKSRALVDVVRRLGDCPDVQTALNGAGVVQSEQPAYLSALNGLAKAGMIAARHPEQGAPRRAQGK